MVKLFSKNSNLCDHNSPTSQIDRQTDGQTERQTTCDRNTVLCTKVHRAVKTKVLRRHSWSRKLCTRHVNTKAQLLLKQLSVSIRNRSKIKIPLCSQYTFMFILKLIFIRFIAHKPDHLFINSVSKTTDEVATIMAQRLINRRINGHLIHDGGYWLASGVHR